MTNHSPRRATLAALLVTMLTGLSACAPSEDEPTATEPPPSSPAQARSASGLSVSAAWIRALAPGQPNGAAFATLANTGRQDLVLTGAQSAIADVVEIHTMTPKDGKMHMHKVERVHIDAGDQARLAPGGHHLMLFGVTGPVQEGSMVPITLEFANHEPMTVDFLVSRDRPGATTE